MWFLKLGFLYALFFGLTWKNSPGYLVFSFYPTFAIILILIILVLFFQSWNTIRLKFKVKSNKWMLFAFFTLGLSSWGISKINVVDYNGANERILSENVWFTYDLQLPEVNLYESRGSFNEDMLPYFFVLLDSTGDEIGMKIEGRLSPSPCYSNGSYQGDFRLGGISFETKLHTEFRLYIDKRIKMGIVNEVLNNCLDNDIYQVSFAVLPNNAKYPPAAYNGAVVHSYVPYEYDSLEDYLQRKALLDTVPNQIQIKHDKIGQCNVNGKPIKYEKLSKELFELFIANTDFIVEYIYSDELPFDDYIQCRVAVNEAMVLVKDFFSWDELGVAYYGQEFYDEKYPLRMLIVSESFLLEE